MGNQWIEFVKKYAKKNKLPWKEALQKAKAEYKKDAAPARRRSPATKKVQRPPVDDDLQVEEQETKTCTTTKRKRRRKRKREE
tara:strand:+ start:8339 stop:8587 length:249 start_codon:yes stop_codon:yes gene_type:complete